MPSSRTTKIGLAILLMLLFIAALAYRLSMTSEASDIVGPSQMAVGADAIYISYNHQIIELSRSGAIRGRHPLRALGMTSPPIDMLRALPATTVRGGTSLVTTLPPPSTC